MRSITAGGYAGELYLVGSGGTYLGREILPSLSAIGSPVDLVLVGVRASLCSDVIAEAGELGAGCAIVLANGFDEAGNFELRDQLLESARNSGITVIGPNTMGIYSAPARFNALEDVSIPSGRVAIVSQSGTVGIAIYEGLRAAGLGLSYFVSLGNQMMVRAADVLGYLADDPDTDCVLVYMEGMPQPAEFLEAAGRLAREKPVAVLRGGVTAAGARAAASHTGSMATDRAVISAGLRAAGVLEASSVGEIVLIAQAFNGQPLARGKRVSLVSDSGGSAVLGADAVVRGGLSLEPHSAEIQSALREIALPQASVTNPLDLIGGNPEFARERAVEITIESDEIDVLINAPIYGGLGYFGGGGAESVERELRKAKGMVAARDAAGKPMVAQSYYIRDETPAFDYLREHKVPVVEQLEDAVAILALQADWNARHRQARTGWVERASAAKDGVGQTLREDAARAWFAERVEVGLPPALVVTSEDEALAAQAELGAGQLVMKILSDRVSHKSDVGGVVVGIESDDQMRAAWERIAKICTDQGTAPAALVTSFVYPGVEALVGALKHSPLGPLVLVGAGGVYAEDIADRAILFPPFERAEIEEAVDQLALGKILNSRRAAPALKEHLIDLVAKVGELVLSADDLLELDLNPVVLAASGPTILDVRVAVDAASINT